MYKFIINVLFITSIFFASILYAEERFEYYISFDEEKNVPATPIKESEITDASNYYKVFYRKDNTISKAYFYRGKTISEKIFLYKRKFKPNIKEYCRKKVITYNISNSKVLSEAFYNRYQDMKYKKIYNAKGELDRIEHYNVKKQLFKIELFLTNQYTGVHKKVSYWQLYYNHWGKLIRKEKYFANNNKISIIAYYNRFEKPSRVEFYEVGILDIYILYEYDKTGKRINDKVYDSSGKLFYIDQYDSKERFLKQEIEDQIF